MTPKTYLSEIQQRDTLGFRIPDDIAEGLNSDDIIERRTAERDAFEVQLSVAENDRRWLLGVVNELSAALEITAKCGCSERFTCSRCKALALLSAPAPTETT
jgi:hypothetical protein